MSDPEETAPFTHQPYGKQAEENPFVSPSGPAAQPSGPGFVTPPPPPPAPPAYPQQPAYPTYGGPGYLPPAYHVSPQNEGLAVASMVVGIVSLVLACGYGIGLLGAPVALVMGRVSLKRIDQSGGQLGGRAMAQAGFILGIIGTVLLVLAIILVVVLVVGLNGGFYDTYSSTP